LLLADNLLDILMKKRDKIAAAGEGRVNGSRAMVCAAALAAFATAAGAQDPNARPVHGEVKLKTGFRPDPHSIALRAGGEVPAAQISPRCHGFISRAPSVRLDFEAAELPLRLEVEGRADTVLLVNGPGGGWYCNDDGDGGRRPALNFEKPESGRYEIWVGTYRPGPQQAAELRISELRQR
jgi:hypothetical protein